jgi:hypothetical protein
MRHIVLTSADDINDPDVEAIIYAALKLAGDPIDPTRRRRLIIKAVAAKRRPRRGAH